MCLSSLPLSTAYDSLLRSLDRHFYSLSVFPLRRQFASKTGLHLLTEAGGSVRKKKRKENGENDDNDDGSMTTAQHVTHSLSCTRTNCRPGSYQSYLNNERAMLSASLCKRSERCCVQKKRKKIPRKSYIHFPSVSLLCSDISRRVSFHHHQIPIHSHTLDASQRRRHRYTLSLLPCAKDEGKTLCSARDTSNLPWLPSRTRRR